MLKKYKTKLEDILIVLKGIGISGLVAGATSSSYIIGPKFFALGAITYIVSVNSEPRKKFKEDYSLTL